MEWRDLATIMPSQIVPEATKNTPKAFAFACGPLKWDRAPGFPTVKGLNLRSPQARIFFLNRSGRTPSFSLQA